MSRCVFLATGCVLVLAGSAPAAYVMTPLSGGASERTVQWGEGFALDIVLSSSASDTHTSAVFQVRFTQPGLVLEGSSWGGPYTSGGAFEDSVPAPGELPVVLGPGTLTGGLYPPGLTDIELGNALVGSSFSTGTLASLSLRIPENFGYEGAIFISLNPDQITSGFSDVPTSAGRVFQLNIVAPAPGSAAACLLLGSVMAVRRRRVG